MSRKHRHSTRHRIFPRLVQAQTTLERLGITMITRRTTTVDPTLVRSVIDAYNRKQAPVETWRDCDDMPQWAHDWLTLGSQADLPIQVVDTTCRI